MADVRLHVPAHMLDHDCAAVPHFYQRLLQGLRDCGATTDIVRRDLDRLHKGPDGAHFDLVHNGSIARPQLLNLAPAYIARFFYADPVGIYFESSIAKARFAPADLPAAEAKTFADALRKTWVVARKSRHQQPEDQTNFGTGHIAIFLQDWSDPVERARYMTAQDMVQTVVGGAAGRQVVVKPHPRNSARETQKIRQWLRKNHPEVRVTEANIHDIMAGACVTVSISSSVALEGMLHRVPAILFGRSDLHHAAVTVKSAAEWPAGLTRALHTSWPYDAFLLWFLRRQNIEAGRPFLAQVLDRMAKAGADFAALHITAPHLL